MQTNLETTPRFSSPEAEISFLREQISNKEQELREKKLHFEAEDVVKDQISRYRDILPKEILDETYAISQHDAESLALNLSPETHDRKMKELLDIFNAKGIRNAMSVLAKFRDPHLEDDFHRLLVQYLKHYKTEKKVDIKSREFRGVDMTLYEVVLPDESNLATSGGPVKTLKELISSMEQFFSGMLSVATKGALENYIVMEIANPIGTDQFVFYVAVPNSNKDLYERQMVAFFPNVRLTQMTDDYNIFNGDGVSVGSYLETKENPVYPILSYEVFDHDPLNVLLSSFSKIEKDGEGASIQIVFAPKGDYFNKKYDYALEQIEKGVPVKDAINLPESWSGGFGKALKGLFSPEIKKVEDKLVPPLQADVEAVDKIKTKLKSTIVATNIRLVASANSREAAEKILSSLESGFNQFTNATSNGLKSVRLEKSKLEKFLREFSFRAWSPDYFIPLNLKELTGIMHFHTTSLSVTPQLKQTQSVNAPAPSGIKQTGTLLGVNAYRNAETNIYIQDEDRLRHFYTIGQTGTGKSTLLKNMIVQDIKAGNGVCMIDPHGVDILDVLANIPPNRFQDVIYFDPSYTERPMALNMLEYDPRYPEQKTFVVNEIFSIFQKLYGAVPESMGPMFEQYFRNATMLVIEDPETGSTLLDVSRVLSNKMYRQQKLERCKNPVVVEFWKEVAEKAGGEAALANIVPYITSKFDVFLSNDIMRPIVSQQKSSFNFREIMDGKKILLVNLAKGRLGDINANLIGLILVGKILMAALSRTDALGTHSAGSGQANFPPFYLYIDEFQNITTNSIATILSEARKYKLSLNIAHQFIAQLEEGIRDAVFGNVGNIGAFRVGSEDAEYLEKQFSPEFTAKDIMNIDNYNAYLKMLVNGRPEKAFNIKTPPALKGDPSIVETLKQLSHLTYGGDRAAIEAQILSKYKK